MDPIMPAAQMVVQLSQEITTTDESVRYHELVYRLASARNDREAQLAAINSARFGLSYIVTRARLAWDDRTIAELSQEFEHLTAHTPDWGERKKRLGVDFTRQHGETFSDIFDLWLRSSETMQVLATSMDARYLHIVQPNQYASKHRFGPHETQIGLSRPPTDAWRVGTQRGYGLIQERQSVLAAHHIVSAIGLFDAIDEEVFVDNCCHFNARGETLLSEFVAREVAAQLAAPSAAQ
jgi:hypothetical protein